MHTLTRRSPGWEAGLSMPFQREETIMNRPAVLAATVTTSEPLQSAHAALPIWLCSFIVVLVAIACAALVLDSSMTSEQHIALFIQTGVFP
jgi:hypothetical protein